MGKKEKSTYLDKDRCIHQRGMCAMGWSILIKATQIISHAAKWSRIGMKKLMAHTLNPLENSEDVIYKTLQLLRCIDQTKFSIGVKKIAHKRSCARRSFTHHQTMLQKQIINLRYFNIVNQVIRSRVTCLTLRICIKIVQKLLKSDQSL